MKESDNFLIMIRKLTENLNEDSIMSLISLIILLVIAGICGSIGQTLVGYTHGGCTVSIIVGFIGALLGEWLARALMLPDFFILNVGGRDFPVIWSIIGAVIFTGIISLFFRRRKS